MLRLLEILRAARYSGHCCFTPGDFCYRWQTETSPEQPPNIHIWTDVDGVDAAFAWLSDRDLHIITCCETPQLRDAIIEWGESSLRECNDERRLLIPIHDQATAWHSLLSLRGYEPGAPELVLYRQSLAPAAVPPPELPPGYEILHVRDAAQMGAWATAYQAAFAPEALPIDVRRAINRSPLYRPELDLIACDEGGEVLAFALAWFDPATTAGTFEPIGCVPAHQRRGLSRALLIEGLRRLDKLDARRAYVTTTRRRIPANRLYESAGFHIVSSTGTWSRQR